MLITNARRLASASLGFLCLLVGTGCSSTKCPWNDQVEGSLKIDGKPLVGVVVDFVPVVPEGGSALPASNGVTDEHGAFELLSTVDNRPGAVIGKHKIVIHAGRGPTARDPEPVEGPNSVPPKSNPSVAMKYSVANQTPLEIEVTPDKHTGYHIDAPGTPK
jgi:hypothetical protein